MPEISIFNNVQEVTNPQNMELLDFLEKIRDGEWEDIVSECRTIKDKKERQEFKKKLPTATMSGKFDRRNDTSLVKHSGYISIDLDHVENLQILKHRLSQDKYVFAVFMSTSGDGLRVMFKIDKYRHRESFLGLCDYIYTEYGEICDPNGSNVSKPYLVSFDPGIYINYDDNIPVFKKYVKYLEPKRVSNFVYVPSDFADIVKEIVARRVNICESYDEWLKVGFAISTLGEDGRQAFHDVSQFSDKYSRRVTDKQYTYCLKAKGSSKVNIQSFYYLAKCHNISIASEQTKTIVRTTKNGKRAGLSKEQITINLSEFHNIQNAQSIVESVYEANDNEFGDDEESILIQLEMIIANSYSLRINEVTGYIENKGVVLSPTEINSMFITAKKFIPKLDYQLMMRLLKSDFIQHYNPFYEFFGSTGIPQFLPPIVQENIGFDSPLIDKLAATIKNENPAYTLYFVRKWIVSIVSAAHKVHSPLLLCLLGQQNTGKTEFFRRLLPAELQGYYAESKLDKEKDDELLMCENLIIMDDELGGKSKTDSLKLKNITSKQWFSLRRPYGDHNEKILRLAVLCGTSNYKEVLTDPTGNRRIIPIEVEDIDKELYNSIDKKELFLEAYRLYREGFDWRFNVDDIKYLNINKEDYEIVIKERELIQKYYSPGVDEDDKMTTTEMLVEIEKLTNQRLSINSIGRELLALGFQKKSFRENGSISKKWMVVKNFDANKLPF